MATLNFTASDCAQISVVRPDGRTAWIRLGKVPPMIAERICDQISVMEGCATIGMPVPEDILLWSSNLAPHIRKRLLKAGVLSELQAITNDDVLAMELHQSMNRERDETDEGFVYFIEAIGVDKIKIGWSVDPEQRIGHLSTGSCVSLRLLGYMKGDKTVESQTKARFNDIAVMCASGRNRGEWFFKTRSLMRFINEHIEEAIDLYDDDDDDDEDEAAA